MHFLHNELKTKITFLYSIIESLSASLNELYMSKMFYLTTIYKLINFIFVEYNKIIPKMLLVQKNTKITIHYGLSIKKLHLTLMLILMKHSIYGIN